MSKIKFWFKLIWMKIQLLFQKKATISFTIPSFVSEEQKAEILDKLIKEFEAKRATGCDCGDDCKCEDDCICDDGCVDKKKVKTKAKTSDKPKKRITSKKKAKE